jgi:hypothetical protein
MCKDLGVSLSEENADLVSEMHSSICALLLLDLFDSGRLTAPPNTSFWVPLGVPAELHGDLWLLVYEAGIRGWGGLNDRHIRKDPHFEEMHVRDIHFYDQCASLEPFFTIRPGAPQPNPQDQLSFFLSDDVEDFIDYAEDESDYDGVVTSELDGDADKSTDAGDEDPWS